jgi:hypothetical protein
MGPSAVRPLSFVLEDGGARGKVVQIKVRL